MVHRFTRIPPPIPLSPILDFLIDVSRCATFFSEAWGRSLVRTTCVWISVTLGLVGWGWDCLTLSVRVQWVTLLDNSILEGTLCWFWQIFTAIFFLHLRLFLWSQRRDALVAFSMWRGSPGAPTFIVFYSVYSLQAELLPGTDCPIFPADCMDKTYPLLATVCVTGT